MRAKKRWKEGISSIDKLQLYVFPSPFFLLSPVPLCFLTSSDVDLQKLDEAGGKKEADELVTRKAAGNKSNFDLKKKSKPCRNPTDNNRGKMAQRRESESKKKGGNKLMFGPKSWRTVVYWSIESIECQQVPSLYFNLLLLFFLLRYTRLALNYLLGLKREGTFIRRDSGLIHPHYAGRKLCKYLPVHSTFERYRRAEFKYVWGHIYSFESILVV